MPQSKPNKSSSLHTDRQTPATELPSLVIDEALRRRSMLKFMLGGAGLLAWPHSPALAQSKETVFRIAMSLSDIPVTRGQADGGAAGSRFINRSIYDALLTWDLSRSDRPADLKPNLAVSWSVDPANQNIWTFKLRRGVKYHDGSLFTAHDVVWNFEKSKAEKAVLPLVEDDIVKGIPLWDTDWHFRRVVDKTADRKRSAYIYNKNTPRRKKKRFLVNNARPAAYDVSPWEAPPEPDPSGSRSR